jgi:hypothetical protein
VQNYTAGGIIKNLLLGREGFGGVWRAKLRGYPDMGIIWFEVNPDNKLPEYPRRSGYC